MLQLPSPDVVTVHDALDVSALVAYLRRSTRPRPVVVVTVSDKTRKPVVDPNDLHSRMKGKADVVVIPTAKLGYEFTDLIGGRLTVYNGALRIYPSDERWVADPSLSRFVSARSLAEPGSLDEVVARVDRAIARVDREAESRRTEAAKRAREVRRPEQSRPAPPKPGPRAAAKPRRSGAPSVASSPALAAAERGMKAGDGIWVIEDVDGAQLFADYLNDPGRTRPCVTLTCAFGRVEPYADVTKLVNELHNVASIVELHTTEATWALSRALPDGLQVYGGACRVYPPGRPDELTERIPLFRAYGDDERARITDDLVSEALRLHYGRGYTLDVSAPGTVKVSGVVKGVLSDAGRALVKIDGGGYAVIHAESVPLGLPIDRLFRTNMVVHGAYDPSSAQLVLPSDAIRPASEALAGYRDGMTVLTRVSFVASDLCKLELYPGYAVKVENDLDATNDALAADLRTQFRVNDVVPALIVHRETGAGDDGQWLMSIYEAGDDVVEAPSVFAGGPPWLVREAPGGMTQRGAAGKGRGRQSTIPRFDQVDVDSLIPPGAIKASADRIHAMYWDLVTLQRDLIDSERELKAMTSDNAKLRTSNRRLRVANKQLTKELEQAQSPDIIQMLSGRFLDRRDQLDFEIRVAWALRYPSTDKASHPLGRWTYAPQFFPSLDELKGFDRGKIVDVIVEIVTGDVYRIPGRDLHELRQGKGGDDPVRTTPHGEIYWRAALQLGAAGGRRIHFYRRKDGVIVLSSVRLHDDYRE